MQGRNIDVFILNQKCNDVQYQALEPAYTSIAKPPAFLFGSVPGALNQWLFGRFNIGSMGVYRVAGGALSCDGLPFYNGTALLSPQWNTSDKVAETAVGKSDITDWSRPTRFIEGDVVSITGPGVSVWGHWLVDFLPRLYVLHLAGYNIQNMRFLLPDRAPGYAVHLLELIGIPASSLLRYDSATELVGCSNLILPSYMRSGNRFKFNFAAAMEFLLENIIQRNQLPPSPVQSDRVLVSRGTVRAQRTLTNRFDIERLVTDRGFAAIDPTAFSILEQIAIFRSAKQVVGEYGSGLHNCMFSPAGTTICALRGSSRHPAFIQSGIAEALDQDLGYVFGESPLEAFDQNYSISEEDLGLALDWMDIRMRRP